jgi:ankyrin repeat protein
MPKALPSHPNLDWLRKAAKERLAELRAREPAAKLHQAQLDIAKDYGFASWRALKAHVDTLSIDGQIISAATRGDALKLEQLLAARPAKIALTGGQWNRPLLHLATEGGHLECVEVLLRHGAEVNQRDRSDRATALHWAAWAGRLEVAKRLVAAGADIEGAGDEHELGIIGWATCLRKIQRGVADWLLARGASPHIFAAVALGRAELVRALVERDPRVLSRQMSRFERRRMPLHLAVLENEPDMVALLLDLGADPAAKDDSGHGPLGYATSKTVPRIRELLLAAGADPAEQSDNRFEAAIPIFNVRDVSASIAYYVEKLGFRKEWDWGMPPTFGCVQRDQVRLFLCARAQGGPGTWLSIFVQDVDALYEDYRRRGATIREAPTDFPWGVREMNVEDLDGHRLRIGSEASDPSEEAATHGAP